MRRVSLFVRNQQEPKPSLMSLFRTVLLSSLCCLLTGGMPNICFAGDGGVEASTVVRMQGIIDTDSSIILQANATRTASITASANQKITNIITFSIIEESAIYISENFTATVHLKVEYGHSSTALQVINDLPLTISYNKDEGTKYTTKKYFTFENAEYVKITVLSGSPTHTATTFNALQVLRVENEIRYMQYFEMTTTNVSPVTFNNNPFANNELGIYWSWPSTAGQNGTQLEWVWLETELEDNYKVSGSIDFNLLFKNNATRIDLPYAKNNYKIPFYYQGSGKLYYRIRPVNFKSTTRVDGNWSTIRDYTFSGFENALNWQATTTFAEEGKRKTVMQFYDGSLRNRQTVTKDNTTNTTVIAETFYDGEGRPAIQILPNPTISNTIEYVEALNLFNGQAANGTNDPADFFDFETPEYPDNSTPPLDPTKGTSRYYSHNNDQIGSKNFKALPDAEGYPYTVTRYTPDGTGRIMTQSGVGPAFKMDGGHETKYYYGTASQEELDGLFGTEAGYASHYFKNMVKDANGQMSVSYVDMHGRTVATALAGNAAINTALDLSLYSNQSAKSVTRNLLNSTTNTIKGNSVESINTLLVPADNTYNFHYDLTPEVLTLQSCISGVSLAYDCLYDLEISITDESGKGQPIVKKFNNISATLDDDPATAMQEFRSESNVVSNIIEFTEDLDAGSYAIRKTLTISEASLQKYKELFITEDKGLCKTKQELIDSVYAVLQPISGCEEPTVLDCSSCIEALGEKEEYRAAFLSSIGVTGTIPADLEAQITAAYDAAKANCDRMCDTLSQLAATKRSLMLADMIPYSGQYAKFVEDDAIPAIPPTSPYFKYDIFSAQTSGTQPFYKKPWNADEDPDYYYTPQNIVDQTVHPGNEPTAFLNDLKKEDFARIFNYAWATALLPHHPEYKRLIYAETTLAESYNWISEFTSADTWQKALDKDYIYTNGSTTATPKNDPFYTVAGTAAATDMLNWVSDTYITDDGENYSMWQMAYGSVMCNSIIDPEGRKACFVDIPKVPPFNNLSTEQKDQVWNVFKSLYAAKRDVQVNAHIASARPLADETTLISYGYKIHFPSSNQKMADQYDWDWYPTTSNAPPANVNLSNGDSIVAKHEETCESYISQWKQALLKCQAIALHTNRDQILDEIVEGMDSVCKKGIDASNMEGASTVAPSAPYDGTARSFEEVIYRVLAKYEIDRDLYCNPYIIEFPKPYGKGPKFIREVTGVIDTCNCSRIAELKAEAILANYSTDFSSFNDYLELRYNDTLTQVLYDAFAKCDSLNIEICKTVYQPVTYNPCTEEPPCSVESFSGGGQGQQSQSCDPVTIQCPETVCTLTSSYYPLSSPQPMPEFLKCGFVDVDTCLSCAELSDLTQEFKDSFPSYSNAPYFTDNDLDTAKINRNVLYQRFINYRTGFQYTWMDYAKKAEAAACNLANYASNGSENQSVICRDTAYVTDTTGLFKKETPCEKVYNMAIAIADNIYEKRVQTLLADFEDLYRAKCLGAGALEHFTVTYETKEYHYTLYYYDAAGNLVRTVPPKGVKPFNNTDIANVKTARANGTYLTPDHELVTNYRYNSLNQVVEQNTPDANTSKFWYDKLGRLVVSQNALQTTQNKYSYTLYDDLGRIIEVGQKPQTTTMTQIISQDKEDLNAWINTNGGVKEEMTITFYDLPYGEPDEPIVEGYFIQKNLRNRVSYSMNKSLNSDLLHQAATFYTYDIHGNVDSLLQDYNGIAEMQSSGNRYKMITYDYDLISGKVNMVSYQPDAPDAYYQRYSYDAENRLTNVETSRDKLLWERDAFYRYYKHGPLARMELGKLQVQGVDYAYTLQGWLKGVNSTNLVPGRDIYLDGISTSTVARDVFGFALHYYHTSTLEDYKLIAYETGDYFATPTNSAFNSLYNGNIAAISINNAGLSKGVASATNALPLFYNYGYDQLNRIVSMSAYKGLVIGTNSWNNVAIDDYKENITYDPNGNITDYIRNGSPSIAGKVKEMDNLHYNYYSNNNQLKQVTDNTAYSGNYTEDIDHQTNALNYEYDLIGNLTKDLAEGITDIKWTVYGKIASIHKGSNVIYYTYDATGNRISKTTSEKTTVYVRDGSGNVMSVYEKPTSGTLAQTEIHLYGSSRLGIWIPQIVAPESEVVHTDFGTGLKRIFTRGEKFFELTNHLGNVLVTVSDRKIPDLVSGNTVSRYKADVISANDYYPFGMLMPGRSYSSATSYRYGFNGKEKDSEAKGEGNQYDYGFRIYDPRIGRFLSVDPLRDQYPWYTPYQFAGNKPIVAIDLDGLEEKIVIQHLGRHEGDGSFYIKSTEVTIDHNARFFNYSSDGSVTQQAVTQVYAEYQGQTTSTGYLEETVTPGGMKPSAEYDYSQDNMDQKEADDKKWVGHNLRRWLKTARRDYNAPDNQETVSNLQDVGAVLLTQINAFALLRRSGTAGVSATKPPANVDKLGGRMIIVDENLSPTLVTELKNKGFNAVRLKLGTKDADILTIAEKNNAIVLTNNIKDFKGFVTTFKVTEKMKATSQVGNLVNAIENINTKATTNPGMIKAGSSVNVAEHQ